MAAVDFLLYPSGVLAFLVACASYVWFFKPGVLVRIFIDRSLRKCGLKVKYVQGKRYRYCYAERGEPSDSRTSLLLVHGFSGSKDMFPPVVKRLPQEVHIVAVDLPGHGQTTIPTETEDISLDQLSADVREFVELSGLKNKPFHLLGTSLGGVIAALYTSRYTTDVERLSLVCPAFDSPVKTTFMEEVERGECSLIPENTEQLSDMLKSCFYNKDIVPKNKQILAGTLALREHKNDFYKRLFESLRREKDEGQGRLEDETKTITCPVQLVWGEQDELIHVSGAKHLQTILPNVQRMDIFDNCGHTIAFDKPGMLVKVLLEFRGELICDDKKHH